MPHKTLLLLIATAILLTFPACSLKTAAPQKEPTSQPERAVPLPTTAASTPLDVKLYGVQTNAKKIVYILDHTGSMLDTFDFLRQETIRSVNSMHPVQQFNVVMFAESETLVYPQLQRATAETKRDFATKMQQFRAQGMSDDLIDPSLNAFKAAFAMQPEVIFFLTDGRFDPRLMDIVSNQLNKNKRVRINTLAFVINDPISEEQLKEMAKKNGGTYKFVSEKDLGKTE